MVSLCNSVNFWEFGVIDSYDKLSFLRSRSAIFTPGTDPSTYVHVFITCLSDNSGQSRDIINVVLLELYMN